jgi:thiol-disulfide isomerase/thioredoxin
MHIFFVLLLLTISSAYAAPLTVGETAENWVLETKEGGSLDYYQDSEGEVSVILFWATWCPYCASLMPHLEEVYRNYRDKGLRFYAVDIFEDGDIDPVSYFDKQGYTYKMLLLGDLVADEYGVKGTPGVYVIDKEKKIVYKRPSGASDVSVKQNISLRIEQALAK